MKPCNGSKETCEKEKAGQAVWLATVGIVSLTKILKILSLHSDALLDDSMVGGQMWIFILNYIIYS